MKSCIPFLISVLVLSVSFSCKKKEVEKDTTPPASSASTYDTTFIDNYLNDTVFPSPYLMTYPGSTWNYDDGSVTECDQWANVVYAETAFANNAYTVTRTHCILPHTNKYNFPYVFYDQVLKITNSSNSRKIQMVDTVVGEFYTGSYVTGVYPNHCIYSDTLEVVELLSSMQVLSTIYYNVIHIKQKSDTYCPHSSNSVPSIYIHSYYSKNVGLIKQTIIQDGHPDQENNLMNYVIGSH
jgi:hypothetical protein